MKERAAGRSAGLVAAGIFLSRITGLVRTSLMARFLGLGDAQDAYAMALRIPNALRNLFGEGTLSAAFVPAYSRLLSDAESSGDDRPARALANGLLGVLLAAMSVLTLIGIALAPWLAAALAPGFDAPKTELTTRMIRVLFPMAGLMVLSGWCLGIQNSHRRFFMSYASAAMWSVAQIILLLGWGARAATLAELAWWLSWATLAGAALQVSVQLPEVWRLVGPFQPSLSPNVPGLGKTLRSVIPVVGALGVVQLSGFADGFIASYLPAGSVGALGFANQLMLLPVALFGISVSAASLPELSRDQSGTATSATQAALRMRLQDGWLRILFYVVPSAVVFVAFGDVLVSLVFGFGRFGAADVRIVHAALAAYALALVAFASNRLFAAVFHSMQDYATPLRTAMVSVCVTISTAALLALPRRGEPLAVAGIALGAALGSWVNFALLFRQLRRAVGALFTTSVQHTVFRIVGATAVAGSIALTLRLALHAQPRWVMGPAVLGVFSLSYLLVSWRLGSAEAARWLRRSPRR